MTYRKDHFKSALAYEGKILSAYKNQIEFHNRLLEIVKSALPVPLCSHVLSCVATSKKVSLYTDSAVWSSQLRFYHQSILQALQSSNQGIFESLQIKIIPESVTAKKIIEKNIPCQENINSILNLSTNQSDEILKNALFRLATTFKNS